MNDNCSICSTCSVCDSNEHKHDEKIGPEFILSILGAITFVVTIFLKIDVSIKFILFLISYILISYDVIINAVKSIFRKKMFDENVLMVIATIGAFAIGEYSEGIVVILLYKIGEFLQYLAAEKYKKSIEMAINIVPKTANLKIDENSSRIVDPKEINIGDIIYVKPGERVPLDGIIVSGNSNVDMSALTGESIPKNVSIGKEVLSGTINLDSLLEIKVTKKFENSTASKIIELIKNASSKKSRTEKFITKFARTYTPIVILIAVIITTIPTIIFNQDFGNYLNRALIFLVVSCPCALVISVPLGFFAGIGSASKKGILVKGSNYLDALNSVDTIVFDKTGTLTKGKFEVTKVVSASELSEEKVLEYIAIGESFSNHYIAKSILSYYDKNKKIGNFKVSNFSEIAGYGISVNIDDKNMLIGNSKLMDLNNTKYVVTQDSGTIIYLAIENEYKGYMVISDELKDSSIRAVEDLKKIGIKKLIMLTGDSKLVANTIGDKLKLDKVYAELLPQDKVSIMQETKKDASVLAYVGDGINDAPVLAASDIGIAMGNGSDIAIESSDIVLMTDDTTKIVDVIKVAKKTRKIVWQNIVFSISVKVIVLVLGSFGIATMWEAVFADMGVSLIALLNSLRVIDYKKISL